MSWSYEFHVGSLKGPAMTLDYVDRILCVENHETYNEKRYCELYQKIEWMTIAVGVHFNTNYVTAEQIDEWIADWLKKDLENVVEGKVAVDAWTVLKEWATRFDSDFVKVWKRFVCGEFHFYLW